MPGSLESIALDPKLSQEGSWWKNYRGAGFDLLIAQWLNPRHREATREIYRRLRKEDPKAEFTDEIDREVQVEAVAQTVWLGARNMVEKDGTPLDPDFSQRWEILKDPRYLRLLDDIIAYAQSDDFYLAEIEGNSDAASAGN